VQLLIFIFPLRRGRLPAILKGWFGLSRHMASLKRRQSGSKTDTSLGDALGVSIGGTVW
jgi:hypothetical protein